MRAFTFIQEVSGVYSSPFLETDGLKMASRTRKVSGAFEKRAPIRLQAPPIINSLLLFLVLLIQSHVILSFIYRLLLSVLSAHLLLNADTQSTSVTQASTFSKLKGFYLCSSGSFHHEEALFNDTSRFDLITSPYLSLMFLVRTKQRL